MKKVLFAFGLFFLHAFSIAQNPWNGKVFLQAYWWNYYNNNYKFGWYNYLAELAPRLKAMGLDAVWVPPSCKASGPNSVGYDPFDNYDLGDKFQKGLKTRSGDKNEYLRMVAVMHANGIDVYQDIVLNHNSNAETVDPVSWDNKYKNFRYVCYETPATVEYSARKGRYPKNWENFHPNPAHNCNSGDICAAHWGPDLCYSPGAMGPSSNAAYNPPQTDRNYTRDNARDWMIWLKKQTGVDGFRFDAVKHFEASVTEDVLFNLQKNALWASGGDHMFAVGEFLDNTANMDNWCSAVKNRAGTFDFPLRSALQKMVHGGGAYNLGDLVNAQQAERSRTSPFINNHDTFRPKLDDNGNYTGWDSDHEIGGHIEPGDPRLPAAYAFAMAVDGNPSIFFEDLFNIGSTSKRFTHSPTSTTDLPVSENLATLIHLYRQLNFKGGAYTVPNISPDHLIIERKNKAIIGINDQNDSWQTTWIKTSFAPGTVLIDYAGSTSVKDKVVVSADQKVKVSTPPCNGKSKMKGFSVWAPIGIPDFVSQSKLTVQEWEMADDLGDSHPASLKQGGALPANSVDYRAVGKIFAQEGKAITVYLHPEDSTKDITLTLSYCAVGAVQSVSGKGDLKTTFLPDRTGWVGLNVRNTINTNPSQKVWVKAVYMAPQVVNTTDYPSPEVGCIHVGLTTGTTPVPDFVMYPNPAENSIYIDLISNGPVQLQIKNIQGQILSNKEMWMAEEPLKIDVSSLDKGIYFISIIRNGVTVVKKLLRQ